MPSGRGIAPGLETLARRNRTLPIVLMHMGQLDAAAAAELIRDHSNIHFMMSQSNPITRKMMQGALPFVNLFQGPALTAQWAELVSRHPDRFVFALDNVFAPMWHQSAYMAQMTLWWSALAKLEPAVAHAVAHGNAERLWKLDPKPATVAIRAPALSEDKAPQER